VSFVNVSPHLGCLAAASVLRREALDRAVEAALKATRLAAANARITASETTVAGAP
jgi:hypothetical protein